MTLAPFRALYAIIHAIDVQNIAQKAAQNVIRKPITHVLLPLLISIALLSGCDAGAPTASAPMPSPTATSTPRPFPTRSATPNPTSSPTPAASPTPATSPTPGPLRLAVDDGVPAGAVAAILEALAPAQASGQGGPERASARDAADLRLITQAGEQPSSADAKLVYERIVTPVDRFSSLLEGITLTDLRGVWAGTAASAQFNAIYPDQALMPELEALLGPAGPAVKPQAGAAVADALWADPLGIGVVAFDALHPKLRALRLDGLSTTDNRLDPRRWPLANRVWLAAETDRGLDALVRVAGRPVVTNRDPDRLTVLVMTGVTAMARGTAAAIEQAEDYAFPARIVGPELAAADITIISNEIPFVAGCQVNNTLNNIILCSRPEYFAALQLSGVDAVGLTGNHLNDFGYEADLASLADYQAWGIPTYGGGADAEAARAPLILEDHGNRLAFLGANQFGPETYWPSSPEQVSAWAGPETPGSARFELDQMIADIQAIRPEVDLVLAEVQHTEFNQDLEYQTEPLPEQVADFRALRAAGADIVTGVQAHAPQAVEVQDDGIILYGLGNLYFDQTWSWATRTGLVARHTIYAGRLLNTELLVTVIEPNMQLRWVTPEERDQVLSDVYAASIW